MYNYGGLLHSVPLLLLYLLTLNKISMTKEDAIQAMSNGYLVKHRHFSDHECIGIVGGMIITEEGYRCDLIEFFRWRTDESWNTDWSIVKDKVLLDAYEHERHYYPKQQDLFTHKNSGEVIIHGGRGISKSHLVKLAEDKITEQGGIVIKTNSKKSEEMRSKNFNLRSRMGVLGLTLAAMVSGMYGESVEKEIQFAEPNKTKPKGNRFVIEGVEIYALNRKNAERKYCNLQKKNA